MRKQEILISGGGMIGLTAACAMAQAGFQVTLVESQPHWQPALPELTDPIDLRVVALNQNSQTLLAKVGIWASVENSRYCAYQHMRVWDSIADGQIHFSAADSLLDHLGYIIEQKVLLGALWQGIRRHPNIRIIDGCQITALQSSPHEVTVQCSNGLTLSGALLIVAEGAQSPLRQLLGIETHAKSYDQTAIVATVRSTQSHQYTAVQRFAPDGPLAWLPLSDPYLTSIVWTTSPENAKRLCDLSQEEFNQALMRESAHELGILTVNSDRKMFPLQHQHAEVYGRTRCVLVGDAAHTIHPLAGQGVNCGFRDLQCLLDSVNAAAQRERDIGSDKVIQHYQRNAKWANQMTLTTMSLFNKSFGTQHPWISSIRNASLNRVNQSQRWKRLFIRIAQGAF